MTGSFMASWELCSSSMATISGPSSKPWTATVTLRPRLGQRYAARAMKPGPLNSFRKVWMRNTVAARRLQRTPATKHAGTSHPFVSGTFFSPIMT